MHIAIISTTQEQTRVRITTEDGSDTLKIPNEDRMRFDSDPVLNDQYFIASVLTVNVYEMPTPDHKMVLWSHLDNGKWRLPHQIMTVEEIKALLDSTRQQIADQGRIVDDRLLSTVKMLERALEEANND